MTGVQTCALPISATGGDAGIRAAKNATKTIPIVMMGGGVDPVEARLVESLARPGGNVTGVTNLNRELGGKRLELLKEAVPKLARIAVLYDPDGSEVQRAPMVPGAPGTDTWEGWVRPLSEGTWEFEVEAWDVMNNVKFFDRTR